MKSFDKSSTFENKQYDNKIKTIYNNVETVYPIKPTPKDTKKKIDRKDFAFWKRHCIEYLRTTGFHGYKYVAMESESRISRTIWAAAVLVCFVTSIILLLSSWNWIAVNPTLTVIESTHYPIWKYPYPAVTVCPLNMIRASSVHYLSSLLLPDNTTLDEITDILKKTTALFGNIQVDDETAFRFKKIQSIINYNNISIIHFLDMLRPKCSEILTRCSWKGSPTRCNSLFQEVKTASGFCCSFNYYAQKSSAATEQKSFFVPKIPRKVAGCGYQTALTVLLNVMPDEYFTTVHGMYGYKIMVHYSYDYPDENSANKYLDKALESFFAVAPEMVYSTSGINGFEVHKRKCIFPNEIKLINFVKYTYINCMVECRTNFVYKMCGCVPFFLPNNGSLPTCNFSDIICPHKAHGLYYSSYPQLDHGKCNCLPDCQQYSYPLEMSTGRLVPANQYNSFGIFDNMIIKNHSLAHIYFNDLVTTRFRKDVFMNWHNLLASFGGLLGLWIGFSLVSGFELIYFFTLRVFFDILQVNKDLPAANPIWSDAKIEKKHVSLNRNKVDVVSLSGNKGYE